MLLPIDHQLLTPRCRLRCVSMADIPHVFSASRHAGFNDGMVWNAPNTIDELHEPHQRAIASWTAGTALPFTIESKAYAAFLGRISIRKNEEPEVWNIGFWIHPQHQGKGYASEAAIAVVDLGFQLLGAQRIEAAHAVWNTPSERVLKKLGMHFIRLNPQGFQKNGQWIPENLLAIEKPHWQAPQSRET